MTCHKTKPMLGEAPCAPANLCRQCPNCLRFKPMPEGALNHRTRRTVVVIDASLLKRGPDGCPMHSARITRY